MGLSGEPGTVPDGRIFYLPFEETFEASQAGGDPVPEVRGFPRLVAGKEGQAASLADDANLVFDAAGNFDQAEGTLAMWVLPYWPNGDGLPHCLFEVPGEPERFLDGGFVVSKGFTDGIEPNRLYAYNSPGHHHITGFPFEPNEWVHLTYSWSASAHLMKLYRNGQVLTAEVRAEFARAPASEGRSMVVGARLGGRSAPESHRSDEYGRLPRRFPEVGGWGADAAIDELMVFDRMLSDVEVAGLAGTEVEVRAPRQPHDGSHITGLGTGLETPHIRFARPWATGEIRAVFFSPGREDGICATRDMAELALRFEVEYTAITSNSPAVFAYPGDFFRNWEGLSPAEAETAALDALEDGAHVIGVANFTFSRLPTSVQHRISQHVRAGGGLVVTRPRDLPIAYQQEADEEGRGFIADHLPIGALSDIYAGQQLSREERARKAIATYRYGRGRVVVIDWYEPEGENRGRLGPVGLAPGAAGGRWSRQYAHRYNYHMALIARAMQWAAGKEPAIRWTELPADGWVVPRAQLPHRGPAIELTSEADEARRAELTTTITDALGHRQWQATESLTLRPGANPVGLHIPQLHHGLHFLDLAVSTGAGVENWATISLHVTGPEQFSELSIDRQYWQRGDVVRGEVSFAGPLTGPAQLRARARDTNGRIYSQTSVEVPAGATESAFAVPVDRPTTLATYIEAELVRNDERLAYADTVVYVPKREQEDFLSVVWCGIWNEGIGMAGLRQLRRAGFTAVYHWGDPRLDFHNDAMADLMPVQYCCRIILRPDKRGWSKDFIGHGRLDPAFQEWAGRFSDIASKSAPLGPPYYSLGDENIVRYGIGYSPYELEAFRQFLEKRYGSIERLNQEYGSDYASFDQVPRFREADAIAQSLIPALVDHRVAVEDEWANYHHRLAREICRIDPDAKVGAEGSYPGDLERTLEGLRFWGPYGDSVLLRSLAGPDVLRSHWWGGYGDGARDASPLWTWLIRGFANFNQFFNAAGVEGLLNRDFSYRRFFPGLLPQLQELYAGPALLLRDAEVISDDPIAVHYDPVSHHASLALRALSTATGSRDNVSQALGELGFDYRYVSSRQIASGGLQSPRAKVLFLPMSVAMSEATADRIAEFVRQGGTLMAEFLPAVLNEYGRRLERGRLDEVFGATGAGITRAHAVDDLVIDVTIGGARLRLGCARAVADGALSATTAECLVEAGGVPLVLSHGYGDGRAILWNFGAARAGRKQQAAFVEALLRTVPVEAPFRLSRPAGSQVSVLRRGHLTLVGVVTPERPDEDLVLSWQEPSHVYDVRSGEYFGDTNEVRLSGSRPPEHVHLLALQSEVVEGVDLDCLPAISRGQTLEITAALLGPAGQLYGARDRVLRLDVASPDHTDVSHYRQFLRLTESRGTMSVPFAFNDVPGPWTIRVTDVATGVAALKKVDLR